ncbi:uncharacterized protein LOC126749672 [Anthonomus grandis grandis]|uniref:uncharacterized protein LOC126749672 n=1 Tax=Anthonomus grandis grandis TaxID=2921223 RepID=UPI002166AB5F|nr:uncharacterized protein LOC126749672 [Anthonomus grandis grandis]
MASSKGNLEEKDLRIKAWLEDKKKLSLLLEEAKNRPTKTLLINLYLKSKESANVEELEAETENVMSVTFPRTGSLEQRIKDIQKQCLNQLGDLLTPELVNKLN